MYDPKLDRYDKYGRLKDQVVEDIQPGDSVVYIDARTGNLPNGRVGTVYVRLYGIWDGEKVQFSDDQQTLVRAKQWLTKQVIKQNITPTRKVFL